MCQLCAAVVVCITDVDSYILQVIMCHHLMSEAKKFYRLIHRHSLCCLSKLLLMLHICWDHHTYRWICHILLFRTVVCSSYQYESFSTGNLFELKWCIMYLLTFCLWQQLSNILKDPEASSNDRFVALELLKNASIAADMVLPGCQDTGTAICMGMSL